MVFRATYVFKLYTFCLFSVLKSSKWCDRILLWSLHCWKIIRILSNLGSFRTDVFICQKNVKSMCRAGHKYISICTFVIRGYFLRFNFYHHLMIIRIRFTYILNWFTTPHLLVSMIRCSREVPHHGICTVCACSKYLGGRGTMVWKFSYGKLCILFIRNIFLPGILYMLVIQSIFAVLSSLFFDPVECPAGLSMWNVYWYN